VIGGRCYIWDSFLIAECVRIVESLRAVENIAQVSYSDVLKVQSCMEFYFENMIRYVFCYMNCYFLASLCSNILPLVYMCNCARCRERGRGNDEAFEQYVVCPLLSDILPSIYHSALGSGASLFL
jgi:hypothetical protein